MIKFNYIIERDEHDEKKIYTPSIPHELKDVVLIEGPNSSGKSTLLNILGLSFFGCKDDNISPSLKGKMKELLDLTHQKIQFSIEIKNTISDTLLFVEKNSNNNDITIYDKSNGKNSPISEDKFRTLYRLIYDIPENPLERLPKLLDDLKSEQIRMSNKIQHLQAYLRDILNEIHNAKDPQQIKNMEDLIKDFEKDKINKGKLIQDLEVTLLIIEKYAYSRFYLEYLNNFIKIETEIKKIGSIKRIKKKKIRSESNELQDLKEKARELVGSIKNKKAELLKHVNILFKNDEFINQLEQVDLENELIYQNERGILSRGIIHFKSELLKKDEKHHNDSNYQTANIISQLIEVLRRYQNISVEIPGIATSNSDFLKLLETKNLEYERLQKEFDNVALALETVYGLEKDIQTFTDEYSNRLRELSSKKEEGPDDELIIVDQVGKLDELKNNRDDILKKIDSYNKLCIKRDIPSDKISDFHSQITRINIKEISLYSSFSEDQLMNEIQQIRNDIPTKKEEVDILNAKIQNYKERKRLLEEKEYSRLFVHKEKIENYYSKCQLLIQLFDSQYSQYLKDLIMKQTPHILTDDQAKYYEQVSLFLGKKIGKFRHTEKSYNAQKIDYTKNEIITKERKIIKFSDLGTGQAQSAYLMGLLNINTKQKLIVLLDEVATMDSSSLTPIKNKLRDLYKEGRLLLGIIVQKSDQLNINSLIE